MVGAYLGQMLSFQLISTLQSRMTAPSMNHQQRLPVLWFELFSLQPNAQFYQRRDKNGRWLPPRPVESNLRSPGSLWYRFEAGNTARLLRQQDLPGDESRDLYRTYSFYSNGEKIFIYPDDASANMVGDGSGNQRISQLQHDAGEDETGNGSSDESDDGDHDNVRDWRELSFTWYIRMNARISHAAFLGRNATSLHVRWQDQGQIRELLPERNHARSAHVLQQGQGGLTGEIPILVALVVYSLPPNMVDTALTGSFRARYQPHQLAHGHGCKCNRHAFVYMTSEFREGLERRGLMVKVWHETDAAERRRLGSAPAQYPAASRIASFEAGTFPGYGRFVT